MAVINCFLFVFEDSFIKSIFMCYCKFSYKFMVISVLGFRGLFIVVYLYFYGTKIFFKRLYFILIDVICYRI